MVEKEIPDIDLKEMMMGEREQNIKKNMDYIDKVINVSTCFIQANTLLEKNPHKYGIVTDAFGHTIHNGKIYCQWKDKFGNNSKERERKLLIIKDLLNSLKIPVHSLNK